MPEKKSDTNPVQVLFGLLRSALGNEAGLSLPGSVDWGAVVNLARTQGVCAIAVDGLRKISESDTGLELDINKPEQKSLRYAMYGVCLKEETRYARLLGSLGKLLDLFNREAIPTLLLKGYGLSLYYPVPNHRPAGDIDIYLYGKGDFADQMVRKFFRCDVKQNEDKHSVFRINGVSFENHACFVNCKIHPSLKGLNDFLTAEAANGIEHKVGGFRLILPSPMFNALFLPFHCAGHFVHGDSSVRQLCDWAVFVTSCGADMDWASVKDKVEKFGFWKFYCCLNGIVKDYLGVPATCLPDDWPRDSVAERRVLEGIVSSNMTCTSLAGKVFRFFSSRWKYKMVYSENMFITSFRLAKSYLRLKDKDAESIWEK